MPRMRSLPGLALLLLTSTAAAAPPTLPSLQLEKTVLPNGLQLILHQDHKLPLVHVNLSL